MSKRKIKTYLLGFKNHLHEEGKTPNTIQNYITTIRTFYQKFQIDLPKIRTPKKRVSQTTEDIAGKKHIREVLKYCNLKYHAIILLMSSSGMGSAEIRHLTW